MNSQVEHGNGELLLPIIGGSPGQFFNYTKSRKSKKHIGKLTQPGLGGYFFPASANGAQTVLNIIYERKKKKKKLS